MTVQLWQRDGFIQIQLSDMGSPFANYLTFGFAQLDHANPPAYDRVRCVDQKPIIQTSLWDLASAFGHSTYSRTLADKFRNEAGDLQPGSQEELVTKYIEKMDELFHYGFTVASQLRGRWDMFQIYMPNYSNHDIAKMIPKRYWSRTTVQSYREDSPLDQPNMSPLLVRSQRDGLIKRFQKKCDETTKTMPLHLTEKFYTHWVHPIIIFDKMKADGFEPGVSMHQEHALEWMSFRYPRLAIHQQEICKRDGKLTWMLL